MNKEKDLVKLMCVCGDSYILDLAGSVFVWESMLKCRKKSQWKFWESHEMGIDLRNFVTSYENRG